MSSIERLPLAPHLEDLRRSGLSDETIRAAGIHTVPPGEIGRKLGGGGAGVVSCYAIPYPGCDGFERFRCFYEPGKEGPKYLQPPGSSNHLYIPPGMDLAGTAPLILTEGEKKSLALTQSGFPAVAIGGVWGWRQKGAGYRPGEGRPIADLDMIRWAGRPVTRRSLSRWWPRWGRPWWRPAGWTRRTWPD